MMKMLTRLLLIIAIFPCFSSAEDKSIDWRIQRYEDMTASVGDKFTFNWNFVHDVYIHPNGGCSDATGIEIGTSSGASYTFTEDDVGEVTFVCTIPGHCFAGQILKVKVSNPPSQVADIPQTAIANGKFETLVAALGATDLVTPLSEPAGPFTVFAPTDAAFASLPDGLVTCLLEPDNKDILADILKYHVLSGKVLSTDLSDGLTATTLNGDDVVVDLSNGVKINNSVVSAVDVEASNGVIHVLDSVLVPSDIDIDTFLDSCRDIPEIAIANGNFETLVAALGAADLVEALSEPAGPFTVFAPTDAAFASLPDGLVTCLLEPDNKDTLADILKYHVLSGKVLSTDLSDGLTATTLSGDNVVVDLSNGVKINNSVVSAVDVEATNGVIHVLDSVLVPSDIDINAFLASCRDIPETAIANGNFETLVAALGAADLVEALSEPAGPFTVFAPTDAAFASLPDGLVTCLLEPDNKDTLADILKYHVLSGNVLSTDLSDGLTATTLNGDDVVVDLSNGVKINDSIVSAVDVGASNGVIHVLDSVLVPSDIDVDAFLTSCQQEEEEPSCKDVDDWSDIFGFNCEFYAQFFCLFAGIFQDANGVDASEACCACGGGIEATPVTDIPQTAIANGKFETLVAALTATNLVTPLSEPAGPFTVFAPTDEAFASLPDGLVGCLLEPDNKDILADILKYHVLSGKVLSTDLSDGLTATTLNGDDVVVDLSNGVKINNSVVSAVDVEATNGVIHVLDSVLVPSDIDINAFLTSCRDISETAIASGNFDTLVAALGAADLVEALSEPAGPFTVLAPTDEAFASLPDGLVTCLLEPNNKDTLADILKYHVISGKVLSTDLSDGLTATTLNGNDVVVNLSNGIKINDSVVSAVDVGTSNGVIHVLDSVLVPSDIDINAFLVSCRDIPEIAIVNGNFDTLVAALGAADLVEALSEPAGPFTVFAPTDAAFARLPDGLVTCLLKPKNKDTLADILKYHVLAGKVLSTNLSDGLTATTLNGDDVVVDLSNGVKINDSVVSAVDVEASNGVIHVLDSVLVPSDIDVGAFLTSCQQEVGECKTVSTQENFVLSDYVSKRWYVHMQAVTKYSPPEQNYCVSARYAERNRPTFPWRYTVNVQNQARLGSTDGRLVGGPLCAYNTDSKDPAKLAVAPCWLPKKFSGDYWVIRYNEDDGYAIISGGQPTIPSGNSGLCKTGTGINQSGLWFFSRSPDRNETLISLLNDIAQNEEGFDTSVLSPVDQVGCVYDEDYRRLALLGDGSHSDGLLRGTGTAV